MQGGQGFLGASWRRGSSRTCRRGLSSGGRHYQGLQGGIIRACRRGSFSQASRGSCMTQGGTTWGGKAHEWGCDTGQQLTGVVQGWYRGGTGVVHGGGHVAIAQHSLSHPHCHTSTTLASPPPHSHHLCRIYIPSTTLACPPPHPHALHHSGIPSTTLASPLPLSHPLCYSGIPSATL